MASQLQHLQRIPDTAGPLTGLEQEALGIQPAIMATIGLVLLAATTPTARGVSTTMVASTATAAPSTTSSSACALPSRLRSSQNNNQKNSKLTSVGF